MNFNLAEMICRKHEDAVFRIALEEQRCSGSNTYTFGGLDYLSDKFATVLTDCGIHHGDVVAVVLPPSAALVVAHFAALKLGAIVAPFNHQTKTVVLEQLVKESQAKVLVIDEALLGEAENLILDLEIAELFIVSDYVSKNNFGERGKGFWYEINFADADFKTLQTDGTTPAYIFFEADESKNFTGTVFNHGLIVEGLRTNEQREDFDCHDDTPLQTTHDWSSKILLFELIYPAWFFGCSIEASDSTT